MFLIKQMKQWALPILSVLSVSVFTSCNDGDDPGPVGVDSDTTYVLSLAIQGSEGGFTYYTVPFEDVMSGTLSAEGRGIEQPGYYDFTQIDETIYSLGGLDDVNVVGISQSQNGDLVQIGDVSFRSGLSDLISADDNTLVSVTMSSASDVITFHKFDANSVTVTDTVEVAVDLLTDRTGPAYSGMAISGDYLYLSYYIMDPNTFSTEYTDEAEVAVFSYPELAFQKVITDDRVGPIGGFNVKSGLVKDENGNVYALSHSNPANGFSQSTRPSGILRIKSGETSFDQDYFFDIEAATGGFNTAHLKYLGSGKAFAEINVAEREEQAPWSDGPLRSAVVDLSNQTVTFVEDVPEHAGTGRRLAAAYADGFVYTIVSEEEGIYVYQIDASNHSATRGAKVEANFVAGFFRL